MHYRSPEGARICRRKRLEAAPVTFALELIAGNDLRRLTRTIGVSGIAQPRTTLRERVALLSASPNARE